MKRAILVVTVAAVGAAIGWSSGVSEYRSVGVVEISPPAPPRIVYGSTARGGLEDAYVLAQVSLFRSRRIADLACGLTNEQLQHTDSEAMGSGEFAERLTVTRRSSQYLAEVAFVHPDPEVATAAVNAACTSVVQLAQDAADDGASARIAALTSEVEKLAARTSEATEDKGSAWLAAQYAARSDSLSRLQAQLDALDVEVAARGEPIDAETARQRAALVDLRAQREEEVAGLAARAEQVGEWERAARMMRDRLEALRLEFVDLRRVGLPVRIVSAPTTPERPFAPNRPQQALLGGVVGLIAGLGVAFRLRS